MSPRLRGMQPVVISTIPKQALRFLPGDQVEIGVQVRRKGRRGLGEFHLHNPVPELVRRTAGYILRSYR